MLTIRAAPPGHYPWLAERAGLNLHDGLRAIMAVEDGPECPICLAAGAQGEVACHGAIVGMVGYDSWWPGAVGLHIALDKPIALRRLVTAGFGTAFDAPPRGLGKHSVTATVLSTNERSVKLVRHLGFRHIHTGKGYAGSGVDVEFFEMRRDECRYIPRALRRAA